MDTNSAYTTRSVWEELQCPLVPTNCLRENSSTVNNNGSLYDDRYLGNKGGNSFVKPWVWIVVLGGGPLVQSICWNLYVFFSVCTPNQGPDVVCG